MVGGWWCGSKVRFPSTKRMRLVDVIFNLFVLLGVYFAPPQVYYTFFVISYIWGRLYMIFPKRICLKDVDGHGESY